MNKKKVSIILFVLVALGLAGFATFLGYSIIEQKIAAEKAKLNTGKKSSMQLVVVTRDDYPEGAIIQLDMIQHRPFPEDHVPVGAILATNYMNAIGQKIIVPTVGGRPLLWGQLNGSSEPTFSGKVPEGMRAITMNVDIISSISGFLQPDDRIDLIMTYTSSTKTKINRILLQNVLVLASGKQIDVDRAVAQGNPQSVSTVTLLVSPENAKRIMLARSTGKITASLRNPQDADKVSNAIMTPWQLFPRPKRTRVVAEKEKPIEFIVGGSKG